MGGKSGSAPQAPDPYTVANAETQYNNNTALFNAGLNRYNTVTPYGSQTWSVSGPQSSPAQGSGSGGVNGGLSGMGNIFGLGSSPLRSGATGGASTGGAPSYTQTISLNPMDQQILDQQRQQSLGLQGAGNNLVGQIQANSGINTPDFNQTRQAAQDALYSNQTQYLDPQFQQSQESLESRLANQGVVPGTEAYDNAMKNFNLSKQSAYSNAMNTAIGGATGQQGQAIQNYSNLTNLPINQLNSIRSGTQVQTPNFQNPAASTSNPADIGNAFNQQYQGQLAGYNANVASQNATTQGLFNLGGTAAALAFLSDIHTKRDVKRIGTLKSGIPVYEFKYLGSDKPQIGVLAQEVEEIRPSAVIRGEDGYLRVDYSKVN